MNHLLLLVFSLVAATSVQAALDPSKYTPKLQELSKSLHTTCLPKSGTTEESIKSVTNGEFIDEPKIKAYMRCILTESGVFSEEKGLNAELAGELIPSEIRDESLTNAKFCLGQIKDIKDKYERVFNMYKCYYGRNPDLFIFF